jgi:membrane protein involved in colicin uptake
MECVERDSPRRRAVTLQHCKVDWSRRTNCSASVEEAWAEAEAKRAAEQAEAAHKKALKTQRKAQRAAQQKALSFSLDDEDEDG